MKIGCCFGFGGRERIKLGRDCGFEFAELSLASLENVSESEIKEFADYLREIDVPCPAANTFFPKTMTLLGEDADNALTDEYIHRTFEKSASLGLKHIVFGSGGARRVPDGFPMEKAYEQLVVLCTDHIAPAMEKYGLVCGIEELFKPACNIINTCREAMALVRDVNHPRIKLQVDNFHMGKEDEPVETIADYRGYIAHVHISNPLLDGEFPKPDDGYDYAPYFDALRKAGYPEDGLVSIEGHPNKEDGFEVSARRTVKLLKAL